LAQTGLAIVGLFAPNCTMAIVGLFAPNCTSAVARITFTGFVVIATA
jgi:hypothetical protein